MRKETCSISHSRTVPSTLAVIHWPCTVGCQHADTYVCQVCGLLRELKHKCTCACMHAHKDTRTTIHTHIDRRTRTHTHTHARARAHTHTHTDGHDTHGLPAPQYGLQCAACS